MRGACKYVVFFGVVALVVVFCVEVCEQRGALHVHRVVEFHEQFVVCVGRR